MLCVWLNGTRDMADPDVSKSETWIDGSAAALDYLRAAVNLKRPELRRRLDEAVVAHKIEIRWSAVGEARDLFFLAFAESYTPEVIAHGPDYFRPDLDRFIAELNAIAPSDVGISSLNGTTTSPNAVDRSTCKAIQQAAREFKKKPEEFVYRAQYRHALRVHAGKIKRVQVGKEIKEIPARGWGEDTMIKALRGMDFR
jgi:hypothetical protein